MLQCHSIIVLQCCDTGKSSNKYQHNNAVNRSITIKECDYINFDKVVAVENGLFGNDMLLGKYFKFDLAAADKNKQASGSKEFVDFFTDTNNTFNDLGFKNVTWAMGKTYNTDRARQAIDESY